MPREISGPPDEMNRPKKLTGDGGLVYTDLVQYNAAGQIVSGTFLGRIETYQFNESGQLTRKTQQLGVDIGYTFSPTANDGRLWKRKNYVSGEEVEYDGFGNLLQQNVTKGSAPTMNLTIDGNTNRVAGQLYDANGNWLGESGQPQMVYDIENRLAETPGGAEKYKYSVSGHRIMVQSGTTYRYHLYGIPILAAIVPRSVIQLLASSLGSSVSRAGWRFGPRNWGSCSTRWTCCCTSSRCKRCAPSLAGRTRKPAW